MNAEDKLLLRDVIQEVKHLSEKDGFSLMSVTQKSDKSPIIYPLSITLEEEFMLRHDVLVQSIAEEIYKIIKNGDPDIKEIELTREYRNPSRPLVPCLFAVLKY